MQRSTARVSMLVKTALIAALTAATAIPSISIGPVPITLQVFFALLAGAVLGPFYGASAMALYVLMGVIGLPVFAGGNAGPGVLIGPRGGYLIGFIAAAFVVGLILSKSGRSMAGASAKSGVLRMFMAMTAGIVTIYVLGITQLAFAAKMTLLQAAAVGAAPFILPDMVKALVAAEVARRVRIAEQN